MADGYFRQRQNYGDNGGSLRVTPFVVTTTLLTPRAKHTIYVQRIHIVVTGLLAGATWNIQDSAGVSLTGDVSVAAALATDPFDFGPTGIALTALATLVFVPSVPGASGIITWDAYQRLIGGSTP